MHGSGAGAGDGTAAAMPLAADWERLCHDLRTPLNAILGNAELLLDGSAGPLSGQARACLGDIQVAGQRLMRHVGALLDLHRARSAPAPADVVPVDLVALLRQSPVAGSLEGPVVTIDGSESVAGCTVAGDPRWLGRLADTLVELYLEGGAGRGPLQVSVEHGNSRPGMSLRLSWVDFHPQQLAALPTALIDAILNLHEGHLRVSADGLRLDWPVGRVSGAGGVGSRGDGA